MISDNMKHRFDAFAELVRLGRIALVETTRADNNAPAFLLCALLDNPDGRQTFAPVAEFFENEPYDIFNEPFPEEAAAQPQSTEVPDAG